MPAYFVFRNRVTDPEALFQSYIPKAVETIMRYNGEVLVVAEDSQVLEGSTDAPRTIVVRFDTREQAEAWYTSEEYQAVRPIRLRATEGYAVLVDGFEMPS
jgi:uncharacterized protein (DUF1330 family)